MFSFHRPKVYRSSTGCCICKAKSSSSRFTDSKKYEEDFLECFKLSEPRQGEICNACVLLVKRWKKLPAGSDRNWKHVVDARAGPGMKSMSKFKSKKKMEDICSNNNNNNNNNNNDNNDKSNIIKKKKDFEREYSPTLSDKSDGNDDVEMNDVDDLCENGSQRSGGSSTRTESPGNSDCETDINTVNNNNNNSSSNNDGNNVCIKSRRRKGPAKRRENGGLPEVSDFINSSYWKKELICCGFIFRGMCGEVAVDFRFLKPCTARLAQCKLNNNNNNSNRNDDNNGNKNKENGTTKVFSDSSSDSGYDESSNQGAILDSAFKKEQQVSIENNHPIPQNN